jgi:hypothetical protein
MRGWTIQVSVDNVGEHEKFSVVKFEKLTILALPLIRKVWYYTSAGEGV